MTVQKTRTYTTQRIRESINILTEIPDFITHTLTDRHSDIKKVVEDFYS